MIRRRFKGCFHYVYVTINLINGRRYVGDHSTKRLDDHYIGSGVYLKRAIRKYGKENFLKRVIGFYPTRLETYHAETIYIEKYNTQFPNGYNISPTGGVHCNGGRVAEETKQKISITMIAFYQTPEGIKQMEMQLRLMQTPEAIAKRSVSLNTFFQTLEGRKEKKRRRIKSRKRLLLFGEYKNTPWVSLKAKEKQIAALKSYYQTSEGIKQKDITSKVLHTPGAKEKQIAALKSYYKTPEGIARREKMRENWTGVNSPRYNPDKYHGSKIQN